MDYNILYFTKDKIFLYSSKEKRFLNEKEPIAWDLNALPMILEKLLSRFDAKSWGVYLSNDLVYILSFTLDKLAKGESELEVIHKKVVEKIPEYAADMVWDYKINREKGFLSVQVAAIEKPLVKTISDAFDKSKNNLGFVLPLTYALAQITAGKDSHQIIFYTSPLDSVVALVNKGFVYIVTSVEPTDVQGQISKFLDFVKIKLPLTFPINFIFSDQLNLTNEAETKNNLKQNANVVVQDLNSLVVKYSSEVKTKKADEKLNLEYTGEPKVPPIVISNVDAEEQPKGPSKKKNIMMIVAVILMFGAIGGALFYYFTKPEEPAANVSTEEASAPTPTPTATPAITPTEALNENEVTEVEQDLTQRETILEDFAGYKLEILNGSGISGEANKVEDLVNDLNFDSITVGNAATYDYTDTIIYFKTEDLKVKSTPKLSEALNTYEIELSEELLPETSTSDIRIIVGTSKAGSEPEVEEEIQGISP